MVTKISRSDWAVATAALFLVFSALAVSERPSYAGPDGQGAGAPFAQGRYLAMLAGCNDCHTDGYLLGEGKIPEDQWLTGSAFGWRGPWGTTYAANLRHLLPALTEEQWVTFSRQLRARPPMPWYTLNVMHETDLRDFYRFVRHLGPGGSQAPAYLPPGQEPTTPYALFPSPPPSVK